MHNYISYQIFFSLLFYELRNVSKINPLHYELLAKCVSPLQMHWM